MQLHEQGDIEDMVMEVFLLTLGNMGKLLDDSWYSFGVELKKEKVSLCLAAQQSS